MTKEVSVCFMVIGSSWFDLFKLKLCGESVSVLLLHFGRSKVTKHRRENCFTPSCRLRFLSGIH